jgi:hypothetical protein
MEIIVHYRLLGQECYDIITDTPLDTLEDSDIRESE